jgi:hypothetical protein
MIKAIVLNSGSAEGFKFKLVFEASLKSHNFSGHFEFQNSVQKSRDLVRGKDERWFKNHFPKEFLKNFEVHHEWLHGERCYLLTPQEHKTRHLKQKEGKRWD